MERVKMKSKFYKKLAILIAFSMLIQMIIPIGTYTLHADEKVVHIETVEDFIEFAENCKMDSYSENLVCFLDKDLDFKGKHFSPVPIFNGVFDGKNHKIKDLNIDNAGSQLGLFRINAGKITNLSVRADIKPSESADKLGVIAGENRGLIEKCEANGKIKGDRQIGGISGYNTENAKILNCESYVLLTGTMHIGGIAGLNEGTIEKSTNKGFVNTSKDQINSSEISSLKEISSIHNIDTNFLSDRKNADLDIFSCAGGIAGKNTGYIKNCINKGNVGYAHIGYNVGGIAGLTNGLIHQCKNQGSVDGRKNIGGIAGQFEPDVDIEYGSSSIDSLYNESKKTIDLLRKLNAKADESVQKNLNTGEKINTSSKNTEDYVKDTATEINKFTKEQMDVIDASFNSIIENNIALTSDVEKHSNLIIDDSEKVSDNLNAIIDETNDTLERINTEAGDNIDLINEHKDTIREEVDRLIALQDNTANIRIKTSKMKPKLMELSTTLLTIQQLSKKIEELSKLPPGSPQLAQLPVLMQKLNENAVKLNQLIPEIMQLVAQDDISDNMGEILYTTFDAGEKISNEIELINDSLLDSGSSIVEKNVESLKTIREQSDDLEKNGDNLRKNASTLNDIMTKGIQYDNDMMVVIREHSKGTFDFVNDKLGSSYEEVYKNLSSINQNLAKMIQDGKIDSKEINGISEGIIDSMDKMTDIMYDLSQNPEYDSVNLFDIKDQSTLKGTIIFSKNEGLVNGDTHVGGISGKVGIEAGDDIDEELDMDEAKLRDKTALLRAIIYKSENKGSIASKTDFVGGIAGQATSGYIYDSSNLGNIEGENYLGGISGYSDAEIVSCNSLCNISGENKIGGISGYATNLTDNKSMVNIVSNGENIGTIAGLLHDDKNEDEENKNVIKNNIFVRQHLGAIDNINYSEKAYPMEYKDFIKVDKVPKFFNSLFVRFYDGEKLIKQVIVPYNGIIEESQIPSTYYDENTYSEWSKFDRANITHTQNVYLEHKPWIESISTNEKIPAFLAQGKFFPDATITVKDKDFQFRKTEFEAAREYHYEITGGLKGKNDTYIVRVKLNPEEEIKALKDKKVKNMKYEMDGSYAVFKSADSGTILIVTPNYVEYLAFAILGGILLLITLIFFIRFLRRRARLRLEKKGII